jgi:hypothetical protein
MTRITSAIVLIALAFCAARTSRAEVIIGGSLNNGYLDRTYAQEIIPGFFLPKPQVWQNVATRTITGPYEDEMSSEPWAGPSPTPVTTGNFLNAPFPEGCGNTATDGDCGVFFKPFTGDVTNGAASASLYQDNPGLPGTKYILTGWAGAEANALMGGAEFSIDFLNAANGLISSASIDLLPTLKVINGESFNYKKYTVSGIAPLGTVTVRARASMINALNNPNGGGQAFVVDDFTLSAVPEPATIALLAFAAIPLAIRRFRK